MSDSKPQPARPQPAVPSSLLDFEPVIRKVKRPDGWTPERQRRFIELLAETGSPQRAAVAMGKVLSGIEALYREAGADSFRWAWDSAIEFARARERSELAAKTDVPAPLPPHRRPQAEPEPEPDQDEEDTTELRVEMIERLVAKWQRKVGQEREARLSGDVVSADFYLRQVTVLEVSFDLMIDGYGDRGWTMLMQARRGDINLLQIADTYMARVLDQARRDQWAAMGEPGRPEVWPERYLIGDPAKVDARLEPLQAEGKASRPAPGYALNEWCQMDPAEQRRIYEEQHRKDAEAQVAWEAANAKEAAEWRAKQSTETKPNDGEADASG